VSKRLLVFVLLLLAGIAWAFFLVPFEIEAVEEHLVNFPGSDDGSHGWRPFLLGVIGFLPAIFSLYYMSRGMMDRYVLKYFVKSFFVCLGVFYLIWVLLDVEDNGDKYVNAKNLPLFLLKYYAVTFGAFFVVLAPYALMLALLYSLGAMSKSREIVAMIQTGRGVFRLICPLGVFGFFVVILFTLLNFQWAPWSEGYRDSMINELRSGTSTRATGLVYHHQDSGRFWYVQRFPYKHGQGDALKGVRITEKEGKVLSKVIEAKEAVWLPETNQWKLTGVLERDLTAQPMPVLTPYEDPLLKDWSETPWNIVKPNLSPLNMGIPDLNSWLIENEGKDWVNRSPYETQWHARWAQPWICLVIVLLAAPLGIVFSRRGSGGGLFVAVLLCAGMMFISTVFLAFGESGNLSPILAAWATNFLFLGVALVLLYRRMSGQPIYQVMKRWLPSRG